MAALLHDAYKLAIIDANAERMGWPEFTRLLERYQPKYYLTQLTARRWKTTCTDVSWRTPVRQDDRLRHARHAYPTREHAPLPISGLRPGWRARPDHPRSAGQLGSKIDQRPEHIRRIFERHDPSYHPAIGDDGVLDMHEIKGLAWRQGDEIVINMPRPFIQDLDDLPIPLHELLPLQSTACHDQGTLHLHGDRPGCPAGCTYCIKHVSYQFGARLRSPKLILEEMWKLKELGINNIHMYADLFTVSRDQVMDLCERMIAEKINIRWTSNSRVDYVDEEMLRMMAKRAIT